MNDTPDVPSLTADMQTVLDYARAHDIPAASLLTCPECGVEHVRLTRDEGRQFMENLAGEYAAPDEPDPGVPAAKAP